MLRWRGWGVSLDRRGRKSREGECEKRTDLDSRVQQSRKGNEAAIKTLPLVTCLSKASNKRGFYFLL